MEIVDETEAQAALAAEANNDVPPQEEPKQEEQPQNQEKTEQEAPPAEGAAPYTPNFRVKALDKELEIDDLFKPVIKDQNTEKKVKELYEKSLAMDHFKTKFSSLEEEVKQKYRPLESALQEAASAYKSKDFDAFFSMLKIPEKDILNWVAEKIKYEDLPEDQKRAYDESRQARAQASQLERQNQLLVSQFQAQAVQARSFELDQVLAKNEVKDAADIWDSVYGPGSFKQEVIKHGKVEFSLNNIDLLPQQAVDATIARMKPVLDRLRSAPQSQSVDATQSKPRVIPNLQGKGSSPAKPVIKSLDDIKKLAASME